MTKLALAAAVLLAHFAATTVTSTASHTCGAVTATSGTYAGPGVRIQARSTIDARTGMGIVDGTLTVGSTTGTFSAVYDHGRLAGTASGRDGGRILATSLSASFSPTSGFTAGRLGGRTATAPTVELPGGCGAPTPLRTVTGTVENAVANSITVSGLTCVVPESLAIEVAFNYGAGTRARIACKPVSGVETLVRIAKQP